MSEDRPKRPKRIYLVNRDFQLRYAFAAVAVAMVSTVLTAIILLYPLYTFEILRIPRFLPWPIFGVMILAVLCNLLLLLFVGVFITHKIAGPMFSLVRAFRQVEHGNWAARLVVRSDDELKYLVRNFNEMIDGLVKIAQADSDRIESALADGGGSEQSRSALALLADQIRSRIGAGKQRCD